MAKREVDIGTFLKALPRMRAFRLLLALLLLGLAFWSWFDLQLKGASPRELLIPNLFALMVALPIIIYVCYQVYIGKIPEHPPVEHKAYYRAIAIRDSIAAIPLFLSTLAIFYFLGTSQFHYILPVLIPSIFLWFILRFLLRRNLKPPV